MVRRLRLTWDQLLELSSRYRIPSLILVAWIMCLVSYVVYEVFHDVSLINAAVNAALATVFSLPALAVGLMKWRSTPQKREDD